MDLQENLLVLIIAFAIWAIVMYLLISSSVRNANKEILYYVKMQYRSYLFSLRKAGYSMEEISSIHTNDDGQYWEWLKSNRTPTEEKIYQEELQKIKDYQNQAK